MQSSQPSFNADELKARFNPEGSPLRRQQLVMLDMVKELDRICRKHDIPYFLYGGTLLGAIRHNGFIPWDDDLDVGLLRDDYKRLMRVLPGELPPDIVLQTTDTDPNYFYFFAKLRNTHSLLDEGNGWDRAFKYRGIFIDIFPFDKVRLSLQRLRLQSLAYTIYRKSGGRPVAWPMIRSLTWVNRHVSFPLLRAASRLSGGNTLTYDFGIPFHIVYDERDIFPLTTHPFEGIPLSVPGNSHHMLQSQFGDYMQLPPLDNLEHHVTKLEFF